MKTKIEAKNQDLQWLYYPDWVYYEYGNCQKTFADASTIQM